METIFLNLPLILIACYIQLCIVNTIHGQELTYVAFRDFEDVVIKLTITLAKAGQFEEARRELKKIEDYEAHMKNVVTQVYDGNYKFTERAVELLYSVNCEAYAKGAEALYNAIKYNGNLERPETLMFANQLEQPDCIQSGKVNETANLMKPYVETILSRWAADIRSGHYDHIYQYMEFSDEQYNSVRKKIPILVKKALRGDPSYTNTTLQFVRDLPYLRFIAPGYLTLIQELKEAGKGHSEEMLMVSYSVVDTIQQRADILRNVTDLGDIFAQVRNEIPLVLQNIFWKETCTIRNMYWKEYLHAAKESADGGNGIVFTWITGYKISAAEWELIPDFEDGKLHFQIRNKNLGDDDNEFYLCESSKSRKAVTCDGGRGAYLQNYLSSWMLIPAIWHGTNGFKLKNLNIKAKDGFWGSLFTSNSDVEAMSFLQASREFDLGTKRRQVIDGFEDDSSHWQIDCF